jgi:hypothetical protein
MYFRGRNCDAGVYLTDLSIYLPTMIIGCVLWNADQTAVGCAAGQYDLIHS